MKNKLGFTSLDVGIVITIIVLLAAIALPSFISDKRTVDARKIDPNSLVEKKIGEIGGYEIYKFGYYGETYCVAIPKTNSIILEK